MMFLELGKEASNWAVPIVDLFADVSRYVADRREKFAAHLAAHHQVRAQRQQQTTREQVEHYFMEQQGWKSRAAMNKADRVWLEVRVRDIVQD